LAYRLAIYRKDKGGGDNRRNKANLFLLSVGGALLTARLFKKFRAKNIF
jgi:hypothetical protein